MIALAAAAVALLVLVGRAPASGRDRLSALRVTAVPPVSRHRLAGSIRRSRRARVPIADVPVVLDLVAGCLTAGIAVSDALDVAASVAPEPIAVRCRSTAAALRAGVPPDDAWQEWRDEPVLAGVARSAMRTAMSGAALAADLRRTASRIRARRRAALQRRVRRSSVWLVIPLGVCFLPAFVLVAVVPVVIGLVPALSH
ncbi:MAG: type II secretion system F family protein [Frankiaceae bacterium]|nr:type II secretion system F family protein [Frankiaceae bacterium]MBV9869900.1 type II secretion system F family protein [Frankiaceae bacterium]